MTGSALRHVPELAREWVRDSPDQTWQLLDGTLCFADVTGFTALAERLSKRGRVGGEELIETLGQLFTRMLDVAAEHGGTLLKFGGDALLLLFRGEGHALAAANAALRMGAEVRATSGTPTSVGPLRVSISMGLHSGALPFFLVGAPHRELLLLGDAASTILATEARARAGEIALSATAAARLPPDAVTHRAGHARLRWRKPRPAPARIPGVPTREDSSALLPGLLDAHLSLGRPDPEHRVACIAFLKISGTDAVLAREGPAALAERLELTVATVFRLLTDHEITVLATDVDHDGFKLFLGAGVPHALEDDEGAMLLALRTVLDADLPLPCQAGVNHGHVFTAEVGSPSRAAYSAMGDTTNTAARITARTPPGRIYAHPSVLDNSLAVFEVEPAAPLHLKGKRAPLPVYDVGKLVGRRGREGFDALPFVGREDDLAALAAALQRWREGSAFTLEVVGPPGIGKSRLMEAALAAAGVQPWLMLRCDAYAAVQPYRVLHAPLRRLLEVPDDPHTAGRALAQRLTRDDPASLKWLPLIAEACGIVVPVTPEAEDLEPRFRRQRLAEVLHRLLDRTVPEHRCAWIDDAQWCDEASYDLLARLVALEGSAPWLLLASGREPRDGADRPAGNFLTLDPMGAEDIRALVVTATEAAPLRDDDVTAVVRSAGGNPMFAIEILRSSRAGGDDGTIPTSLEAALAARADGLDPYWRRVLRCAAVLGYAFSIDLLRTVLQRLGHDTGDAPLAGVDGLIEPDGAGQARFVDAMVRDVVYAGTAFRLRRQVHLLAAEVLLAGGDADRHAAELAVHFEYSGDAQRCWQFARLAADRAAAAYANTEAARLYRAAVESGQRLGTVDPGELRHVWTRLGEVYELAGRFAQSMDAYRQALVLAGEDPATRATLLVRRARAKERRGLLGAAYRDLRLGLRLLDGAAIDVGQERANLLAASAMVRLGQDRFHDALRLARSAESQARQANAERALGRALIVLELASLALEGPGDGRYLAEAEQIFAALNDLPLQAEVHVNQGFRCAHAGHWRESVQWLRSAGELFLRTGNTMGAAFPALNLGEMLAKQQRYDEAEPVLQNAWRTVRAAGFAEGEATARVQIARIRLARGQCQEAAEHCTAAASTFTAIGQPLMALVCQAMLTEVWLELGKPVQALEVLEAAIAAAGRQAETALPMYAPVHARVLAALGRTSQAANVIEQGLRAAREHRLPYEEATLLTTRTALAGGLDWPADPAGEMRAAEIRATLGILPTA